jgi:hypothetical protein
MNPTAMTSAVVSAACANPFIGASGMYFNKRSDAACSGKVVATDRPSRRSSRHLDRTARPAGDGQLGDFLGEFAGIPFDV